MNLLADEGVDRQIVALLREAGHSVTYVAEMEAGVPDEVVLDLANREARTLLTADKDFGELAFRRGLLDSGVILVRLSGLTAQSKAQIVASVVEEHAAELVHSPSSRREPFGYAGSGNETGDPARSSGI